MCERTKCLATPRPPVKRKQFLKCQIVNAVNTDLVLVGNQCMSLDLKHCIKDFYTAMVICLGLKKEWPF